MSYDLLREDLTVYVGVDYVKFWGYVRPVEETYAAAGHSFTFEATGLADQPMTIHEATVQVAPGGGWEFAATVEVHIPAAVTATLTPGTAIDYIVAMVDSQARTQVIVNGRIYALKVAALPA